MRVAIDVYHALFPSGGIPRYARALVKALTEMAPTEEFILFYNRFREQGPAWRPMAGTSRIRQTRLPRRMLQGMWNMLEWPPIELICGSLDVFHGLHFVLPPVRRARRVLTVHDLTYLKFPHYFNDQGLNDRGHHRELPRALARADAVIADSHSTREDLLELMKVPAEKVRVIHLGVEHRLFTQSETQEANLIRKMYGLSSPYLVFLVGTPEPRKNLTRTVAAARRGAPELVLALIGPEKPLRSMLGDNLHNIVFIGVVPDDHLPALLSGACISLYPSLYEGFGLPVLESMACGVPVITSNRSSLPEIVGEAAILVDPEDEESIAQAIWQLMEDETLRAELSDAGRQRAASFSWRRTARETLALYRELL